MKEKKVSGEVKKKYGDNHEGVITGVAVKNRKIRSNCDKLRR